MTPETLVSFEVAEKLRARYGDERVYTMTVKLSGGGLKADIVSGIPAQRFTDMLRSIADLLDRDVLSRRIAERAPGADNGR